MSELMFDNGAECAASGKALESDESFCLSFQALAWSLLGCLGIVEGKVEEF
jgi:hypothetical protein